MKVQHIGRDTDNLCHLLDQVVLGRIAVIVLNRVQVGWVHGTPIFTL